jgi:hypothetical protein
MHNRAEGLRTHRSYNGTAVEKGSKLDAKESVFTKLLCFPTSRIRIKTSNHLDLTINNSHIKGQNNRRRFID